MMTEESESNPGWLRDWSSHEAIRSLTEQVSMWKVATAVLGIAFFLGLAAGVMWGTMCRTC